MTTATKYTGQPVNHLDGKAKVTGVAKYAAEFNAPDLAYGLIASSAIAKGRIAKIDASRALRFEAS